MQYTLEQLTPGMTIVSSRIFSEQDIKVFASLAPDDAPLHHDTDFARKYGYKDVIVFGFLVAAPFSGMLGSQMPGPMTVLHTLRFGMAAPVYIGEEISYRAEVKQVSRSTGAIVVDLLAKRVATDEVVLRGQAQCGFKL